MNLWLPFAEDGMQAVTSLKATVLHQEDSARDLQARLLHAEKERGELLV